MAAKKRNTLVNIKLDELRCDAIESKPRDFDFSEGYTETWDYCEASRCGDCNAVVIGREGDRHSDVDHESECNGHISGEGPMMSYFYPVDLDDAEEAARKLVDTCLCVVTMTEGNQTGLALTGGGMDLSWEICAAFIALGFLPPLHFCDLPGMAGRPRGKEDAFTIKACLRSCEIAASRAMRTAERIRDMVKWANKRAREAKKTAA
jgi:hypothetical protein